MCAIPLTLLFSLLPLANCFDAGNVDGYVRNVKNRLLPHSYEASIRFINRHFCGGAIIGPFHILTAAHCFYQNGEKYPDPLFKYMSVVIGFNGNLFEGGQSYKIKNVTTHEDLLDEANDFWISDIAVITLESEIKYSTLVQPIELPYNNITETARTKTSIWSSSVQELQTVEVHVLSHERCLNLLKEKYLGQYDSKVCGYTTSRRNLCLMYDGSPLVQNDKVVGIASSSDGCRNGQPDVYTNVYRSLYFIKKAISLSYSDILLFKSDFPKLDKIYSANVARERSVVQTSY